MNRLFVAIITVGIFSNAHAITIDDFLRLSTSEHPLFLKESERVNSAQSQFAATYGSSDISLDVAPSLYFEEPISNSPFTGGDIHQLSGSIGLSKHFWTTGGSLSLEASSARLLQAPAVLDGTPLGTERFFTNRLSLTYTQPLLKNLAGTLSRLNHDIAEINIDVAKFESDENKEQFLESMAFQFLDWAHLVEQERILKARLKISADEYVRTQKKRKSNLVTQADLLRAEDAVRIARQNLVLIEGERMAKAAEISVLFNGNSALDDGPKFDLYTIPTIDTLDTFKAEDNARFIDTLDAQVRQQKRIVEARKNQLLPDLNLVLAGGIGDGDEDYDNALDLDKSNATIALSYAFPVQNSEASGDLAFAKSNLTRLQLQREESARTINSIAKNLYTRLTQLQKVLQLNQEQITSARKKTKEELSLYRQGRNQYTFVIQARDNEQFAKLSYAANALQFHKLYYTYLSLTDQLLKDVQSSIKKES